jgi:hypothetical protein
MHEGGTCLVSSRMTGGQHNCGQFWALAHSCIVCGHCDKDCMVEEDIVCSVKVEEQWDSKH